MAKSKKPVTVSEFKRLVALVNQLGNKQKTTIRKKTEEGTLTLSVDGMCCTSGGEFANQCSVNGAKAAFKAEAGFGKSDGSGGASLDANGARIVALEMINGRRPEGVDELLKELEEDTETETGEATVTVTA